MAGRWLFVYRDNYDLYLSNASIFIPVRFTSGRLIVKASCQPVFNPGSLLQIPFVDGFGDVRGNSYLLRSGLQFLSLSNEFPYRLMFEPAKRVDEVQLAIWVDTMPVYRDDNSQSATSATTASIAASITSVTLLAANNNRKGATIYNNSSVGTLYIGFGASVTVTAFAEKIGSNSLWEMPIDYDGQIVGIWSAASGNALVTEFV